jgi:hypothetical protein
MSLGIGHLLIQDTTADLVTLDSDVSQLAVSAPPWYLRNWLVFRTEPGCGCDYCSCNFYINSRMKINASCMGVISVMRIGSRTPLAPVRSPRHFSSAAPRHTSCQRRSTTCWSAKIWILSGSSSTPVLQLPACQRRFIPRCLRRLHRLNRHHRLHGLRCRHTMTS